MNSPSRFTLQCPISLQQYSHIQMAHGGGGRLMHQLIEQMFLATFGSQPEWAHDSACLKLPHGRLAFTTDSYVVSPLFFPGGDIGAMAVYGTVNDLAMSGAIPRYLSLSFILEEGFSMSQLWNIVQSIQAAADLAEVNIVTGDTKVVERGKGDGIYINTAGVGVIDHPWTISPHSVQSGDAIILSGDLGRHGIAIMAQREGFEFDTELTSDLAPLSKSVQALIDGGIEIHCLRDLTRGGLATALNEIVQVCQYSIHLNDMIPIHPAVKGACEILGLDPLYLANEGRFIAVVPEDSSDLAIALINQSATQQGLPSIAQNIGKVVSVSDTPMKDKSIFDKSMGDPAIKDREIKTPKPLVSMAMVTQQMSLGGSRLIDLRNGEQMPRIC